MGNYACKVERLCGRFNTDIPLIRLRAGTDMHFVFSGLIAYIRGRNITPMNADDQLGKARIYRDHLAKADQKRSTMITIALAEATLISVALQGFGFVQKGRAEAMQCEVEQLKPAEEGAKLELIPVRTQLDACIAKAETANR